MRLKPGVSVLAVPAGARAGSYIGERSPEHDGLAAELRNNPRFRDTAIEIAAIAGEREANRYKVGRALRSLVVRPVGAAAISLGIHPYAPFFALRYGRRGNLVNALRRRGGVGEADPLTRPTLSTSGVLPPGACAFCRWSRSPRSE